MASAPLLIAIAERPFPGEQVSGDACCITWYDQCCRIAVIDGLGHGPAAAQAAQAAVRRLNEQPTLNPAAALEACHAALVGTRGAAISIVRLDLANRQLTFAGIGNVDGRSGAGASTMRLSPYRGIVGSTRHQIRSFDYPLAADWWLLLHTDGVSNRLELPHLTGADAAMLQSHADHLLARWSRSTDDATVLLVVPRPNA